MLRPAVLFLVTLLAVLTLTFDAEARSKREAAMAAANAAKEDFASGNEPTLQVGAGNSEAGVTTRRLRARVIEPGSPEGAVLVEGDRWLDGTVTPWSARLDLANSEIIAKRRADFDGRKQLGPTDLVPGQELLVVVEVPSMAIRKVKVFAADG